MSGGVDSSVVAGLLVEQGLDVVGVHMKLHDTPAHPSSSDGKHCCGLDDALDARRVADRLGIPFFVMDLQAAFRAAVMDEFAAAYRAGATPNPCITCNGVLKFRILLQRVRALGASHLATGHYAQITPDGGLAMAVDRAKDQSYFLFPVTREALGQTLFPLGSMTKPEVRAHAARLGLVTASKPESQEVCFLPNDDHTRFVTEQGADDGAGEIVDQEGNVLGTHDAYWRFTIGQRRGLDIALGRRVYVLKIDPASRQVVVGPPEALQHAGVVARDMNWFSRPTAGQLLTARVRHRGTLAACTIEPEDDESARVRFLEPVTAAARGQGVVVYDGDRVVAGGWIQEVHS